jgi:hypothetical protein
MCQKYACTNLVVATGPACRPFSIRGARGVRTLDSIGLFLKCTPLSIETRVGRPSFFVGSLGPILVAYKKNRST